ncbi:hypothetical protein DLM76_20605 [Leptospira yasudae]|uniref:hypothetical protein n=1 Tax=Leptospira yasudae TaxID=2202201 RepID=UPI000E59FF24|nr:hypothetical protein [Leptospira yasudae]RHX90267.1 hypothetical protein DLM76_20605 [Leptospira yasudae]
MSSALNFFLKGIVKEFFFPKRFREAFLRIERTITYKYIYHYSALYKNRIRLILIFVSYHLQMLALAFATWKLNFSFSAKAPGQIMVLHYDPRTNKNPEGLASKMARYVAIPFKTLYKFEPIILILPNDEILQTGSIQGMLRSLNRDQLKTFWEEYCKFREKQNSIEIVGS